jgi:integrase
VQNAAGRAGLPPAHPHMLRHSCGFAPANRGYDLRLIQDYLGHRDPKHTVHYTRVAAGRFEGLWREAKQAWQFCTPSWSLDPVGAPWRGHHGPPAATRAENLL